MRTRFALAIFLFSFLSPGLVHGKEDVVAVISSDLPPYQNALKAFQETFQQPIVVLRLTDENARLSGEPKVVVAFGAKAALFKYPESSAVVYGVAPGTRVQPSRRSGPVTEIPMMPAPQAVLQKIRSLQPGIRRLAMIWLSPANGPYADELQKVGRKENIDIQIQHLHTSEELPDRLRALQGQTNALWIPSDPLLVTDENLILLEQFSTSARIPLYSSIPSLIEEGAVAALSVSDHTIGQAAAQLAKKILNGSIPLERFYVDKMDVVVNLKAAEALGLKLTGQESRRR